MAENVTSTTVNISDEQNADSFNKDRDVTLAPDNEKVSIDPTVPKVQMSKSKVLLAFLGLALSILLAALDQTIVATALPKIAQDFSALDQISWVGSAYLLTATAFQPTYGKFSDIFGRKSTFLTAIVLFELGSLLCGLATNMDMLIIARAIAGLGGGGIFGLVLIIISEIVSLQDRGKYQGMIGGVFGISSVIGPLLGGAFTDHASWRWAFYINLPLGAIAIIFVIAFLHLPHPEGSLVDKLKRIDWFGTIFIAASTVCVLLPLNWGGNTYEWDSPVIIVLFCVGGVGYIIFAYIEGWVAKEPLAPGRLFRNRTVAACFSVNFWQGMAFFSLTYFVPLFYQIVKGDTATESGLELLPLILGVVIASIFSGQLASRTELISYKAYCIFGAVLITVGSGLISTFDENSNRGKQIGYLLIAGVGVVGAVFGIAIFGTIFNNQMIKNLEPILGELPSADPIGLLPTLSNEMRMKVINAFVDALSISFKFLIPVGILCLISAFIMRNVKPTLYGKKNENVVIGEL
ncbi:488_t:CDS:10 [Diversispora eburnea]|uniref:MFS-type drug efflux transporter P55 n=1 Tax=Diversispora eburnea TaxID=1213867 RepID=A0A9N9BS91_9GLOM|nr:488_t:CDS:10 [Diversispora eburnea]